MAERTPDQFIAAVAAAYDATAQVVAGNHARAGQILAALDTATLTRVNAAAGDLRIIAAETLAQRAESHTRPAVANADGTARVGERDRIGGTATDELSGPPLTFFERRAARDPSIDHSSHSQGWVGRCLECSDDQENTDG